MAARLAVVTGGAGDIGQAIARRLLRDHDAVLLADRDLALAEAAARDLGRGCTPVHVDVTDPARCAELAAAAAEAGGVATLVNNAGAAAAVSLHGTDAAGYTPAGDGAVVGAAARTHARTRVERRHRPLIMLFSR